jgi:hypothetical protein
MAAVTMDRIPFLSKWVCGIYPLSGLRLALSKGSDKVGVSFPTSEDVKRSISLNIVFYSYLYFRTMNKVHKPNDS